MCRKRYKSYLIIIYMIFGIFLFEGFFIDLGCPSAIKYILDILNIILFLMAIPKIKRNCKINYYMIMIYTLFILTGTFSLLVNGEKWNPSIFFLILDYRNFLRFPMFFISCNLLLEAKDVEDIFDKLLIYQVINTLLIIYQYFTVTVWDYWMRGDYLNGLFGVSRGGNMYVNVLMLAVFLIVYDRWTKKKMNIKMAAFIFFTCLLDAVLIELKIYFVEIILCVFAILVIKGRLKYIKRKQMINIFSILICGSVVIIIMINVLYKLYPSMKNSLSLSNIIARISSSDGYTSSGDLNRITAISGVFNNIFKGNLVEALFGIGLGNASTGGTMSLFAKTYRYTNYSYFQSAYVFIETGIVGLGLYVLSFAIIYKNSRKDKNYTLVTKIMSLMSIVLIIYDEVLKTEGAYIIYFFLALAFLKSGGTKYDRYIIDNNSTSLQY